jgi:transposase
MARYGKEFKKRAVARLLPPESSSVDQIAAELGVRAETLERWRAQALSEPASERVWTAEARLEAVIATASMDDSARSAWCREHGVYPSELAKWRAGAVTALAEPAEARATPQQTRQDRRRIRSLERQLGRKDKALAETAALLVLSKKLSAVFHEDGDE